MASKDSRGKEEHPLKGDPPQDGQQPPPVSTSSGAAAPSHDKNSQHANSLTYSQALQGGSTNVTDANTAVSKPREQCMAKV